MPTEPITLHDVIDSWQLDYYTATAIGHLLAWKTYGHLGDLEETGSYLGLAVERARLKPSWTDAHNTDVPRTRIKGLHPHAVNQAFGLEGKERDVIYRLFEWADQGCCGCLLSARDVARELFAEAGESTAGAVRKADAERLAMAEAFAAEWDELITQLPDSYSCTLTCGEANAASDFYDAMGRPLTADAIIGAHSFHDSPGDEHYDEPEAPEGANPVSRTVSARSSVPPRSETEDSSGDHGD